MFNKILLTNNITGDLMLFKILIVVLSIIILLIVFPHKIRIKYRIYSHEKKKFTTTTDNVFVFYIFGFIPIKKKLQENKEDKKLKNTGKKSKDKKVLDVVYNVFTGTLKYRKINEALLDKNDLKKIKDSIYFEKINLDLGINLQEIFLNIYILGIINTLIPMYIAVNQKNFNMDNLEYRTYISNNIIDINLDCIMKVNLIHTISVIVKVIYKIRKVESKNGRATSNRKFNDDSYDIARKYD